ncbi:MAG: hypothetical protein WAX14_10205 [Rhodococcus sp. (in: high G+C Gram-positive bacteria)]|uniref:hypothetical protein n=1 Tax=Rhodococcus sp. TaxID=1831 RepID=UPI003BB624CE
MAPTATLVAAAPAIADTQDVPVADVQQGVLCTPSDAGLAELSGLAVLDGRLFAVPDAGSDESAVELGDDCSTVRRIPAPVDPYDVEDLASGPDGRLWLSDTGDNTARRDTAALISLDPDTGAGDLYRLTYPAGARDAETLLIGRDGVPLVVTKALFGASSIYRPAGGRTVANLTSPGPNPLEEVGTLRLGPTDTPGGPLAGGSSTLITGGAVSADGTVAAVRTYTDVYLFHAPDGDLAAALATGPDLRIPVPGEPQGEAVAFTADGDLLTASEANGGTLPEIRMWPGVAAMFAPDPADDPEHTASGSTSIAADIAMIVAGVAVAAVLLAAGAGRWRRRTAQRR